MEENIMIVIDVSGEMDRSLGNKKSRFEIVQSVLKNFIVQKDFLRGEGVKWGIIALGNDWADLVLELTQERDMVLAMLDSLGPEKGEATAAVSLDLVSLGLEKSEAWQNVKVSRRLLLIFGRSDYVPQGKLCGDYVLDLIYLHAKPSDENLCQEIYSFLTTLPTKKGYFFETATSIQRLQQHSALLLANPSFRDPQETALAKFDWMKPQSYLDKVASSSRTTPPIVVTSTPQQQPQQHDDALSSPSSSSSPTPVAAAVELLPTAMPPQPRTTTGSTSSSVSVSPIPPLPDPADLLGTPNSRTRHDNGGSNVQVQGRASV